MLARDWFRFYFEYVLYKSYNRSFASFPFIPLPLRKRVTQRRWNFVWYNRAINEVGKWLKVLLILQARTWHVLGSSWIKKKEYNCSTEYIFPKIQKYRCERLLIDWLSIRSSKSVQRYFWNITHINLTVIKQ